ncbi:MAG: hypothetical protein HY302_03770 [Opitutae bacterium]|nr:hypothetical protein [Opitutae bacterium]
MKTILSFFASTALLVGVMCYSSGRPPGVLMLFASGYAAALLVWTLRQYERRFDPLPLGRPVRLPVGGASKRRAEPPRRLAA